MLKPATPGRPGNTDNRLSQASGDARKNCDEAAHPVERGPSQDADGNNGSDTIDGTK